MDKRIQRYKRWVNVDFFKRWSPDMAYVLGYFCADGGMFLNSEGSKYIHFVSVDRSQLDNIKRLMDSRHRIMRKKRQEASKWKPCYILEIGSREMYNDLVWLGLTPNKEKSLKFPKVPDEYIKDFTRGYFDGDGCISSGFFKRSDREERLYRYFNLKFACGSLDFLRSMSVVLSRYFDIGRGSIIRSKHCNWLSYSKTDGLKLLSGIYNNTGTHNRLERKYIKFNKIFQIIGDVA